MRNKLRIAMPAAALLALAGQLLAGGFFLQLGNPEASAEARKNNAVLTIKATGCHDPATAQLTATAVGMVNGKRQSIPLTVTKLSGPGMFALSQQWPKEGKWVIELVARNGEQFTNSLVAADANGVDRLHAKANMKQFSDSEVEAMLQDGTR
ncbi:MAG TPA: hypothetical protein VGZ73_21260 [Bryobacteraceae bacterium]|jgi:hypothetical protein|nr:hypothetical protein [Bryobacteraceae bacterium]